MIFRRKRDAEPEQPGEPAPEPLEEEELPAPTTEETDAPAPAAYDRSDGPYDLAEVAQQDPMLAQRIDLGGVQIPLVDGLEVRVEIDQESNTPMAVTLIRGDGAVQVRAFAGPRSGGSWADALAEIRREFTSQGGTVDQSEGPFGTELRTTVAAQDDKGRNVVQPIRFVGVEGPRWMLQGVLFGDGTVPGRAGHLEDVFRSVVVVRGDAAMPPGAPLPLTLPQQVPGDVEEFEGTYDDDPGRSEPPGVNGGPPR